MSRRLTVRVPDRLAQRIDEEVETGLYTNGSDVIRTALRVFFTQRRQ